ncbi:MAG: elongation factor 1-beta [Candidatus Methanomethylicota archaeon]|uniref:Elongation factor 1-beta n=1 Tax=Thermoproteota archaeon TaxID=2056631 RepID=A0A497EPL3_9CREN|nr:MAG: elongation factor 1-beta [Candidatus Verstraetearchaeota archaeon]RLE53047.1 MAG: elongation factor 1-beta [Candidatus Verstraetearchaeota archaeon]
MPAKVVATVKVLPEGDEVNLNELKEELKRALPSGLEIYRIDDEPIAFGLVALKVHVVMPADFEGGTSSLEDAFSKVKGVGQVEVELVRQVSL